MTTPRPRLSACIIARNEAGNLPACLVMAKHVFTGPEHPQPAKV